MNPFRNNKKKALPPLIVRPMSKVPLQPPIQRPRSASSTYPIQNHIAPPTLVVIEPSSDNDSMDDPHSGSMRPRASSLFNSATCTSQPSPAHSTGPSSLNSSPGCGYMSPGSPMSPGTQAGVFFNSNCSSPQQKGVFFKPRAYSYSMPGDEANYQEGSSPSAEGSPKFGLTGSASEKDSTWFLKLPKARKRGRSLDIPKACVHCLLLIKLRQEPPHRASPIPPLSGDNSDIEEEDVEEDPDPEMLSHLVVNVSSEVETLTKLEEDGVDAESAVSASPSVSISLPSSGCGPVLEGLTEDVEVSGKETTTGMFLEVPQWYGGGQDVQKPRSSSVDDVMYGRYSDDDARRSSLGLLNAPDKPRASSVDGSVSAGGESVISCSSGGRRCHHHHRPCHGKDPTRQVCGAGQRHTKAIAARRGSSSGLASVEGWQTWRSIPDWTEDSINEDHMWVDTNASGDLCYVNEAECCKSGFKKKCTACKIIIHTTCLPKLKFPCRPTFRESSVRTYREDKTTTNSVNHHWVHRRRQEGKCKQCSKTFQTKFPFNSKDIAAIQCSWCKAAYHNKAACFTQTLLTEACSLGGHKDLIVPPSWIIKMPQKNTFKSSVRKPRSPGKPRPGLPHQCSLGANVLSPSFSSSFDSPFVIKPIPAPKSKPLLVFINPRSGGNQGVRLLQKFQWLLNPRQIFDLSEGGPRRGLEMFSKVSNVRILACGGDGTAGWILSEIDALGITPCPPMAILPLGTGNDLARTLGWGAGYVDEPMSKILCCVEGGKVVALDRWNIETSLFTPPTGMANSPSTQTLDEYSVGASATLPPPGVPKLPLNVLNNYFSLGADAATALEFHESREANPEKFNSRLKNKMFYLGVGSLDIVKRSWRDLCNHITLQCDGMDYTQRIRESKIHCLLFLNIPRYSAGTLPWGSPAPTAKFGAQAMDDGYLEVIGLTSASLAALQVGSHGDRICQCRNVVLTTFKTIPMQVDGEPCRLQPSKIEITCRNQAFLVKKPKRRSSYSHLNEDGDNGLYDVSTPTSLKLSVFVIPLVDYEENPFDRERLRLAAKYAGVITVDSDADLPTVRTNIAELANKETSGIPQKWVFLDSTTTERFFRIDPGLESVHFIMDICAEEVYILGSDIPSSLSVDARLSEVLEQQEQEKNGHEEDRDEVCREEEEEKASEMEDNMPNTHNAMQEPSEDALIATAQVTVDDVLIHSAQLSQLEETEVRDSEDSVSDEDDQEDEIEEVEVEPEVEPEVVNVEESAAPDPPQPIAEPVADVPVTPSVTRTVVDGREEIRITRDPVKHSHRAVKSLPYRPECHSADNLFVSQTKSKSATLSGYIGSRLRQMFHRPHSDTNGQPTRVEKEPTKYAPFVPKQIQPRKYSTKMSLDKAYLAACKHSNVEKVKQLVEVGADPLVVDSSGMSGLHYAAKMGHIGVVHYIINRASPHILEIRDHETGQTALHKASSTGRRSVCSLLISAGALCQSQDKQGLTPRDLALAANDTQLAQFLESKQNNPCRSPDNRLRVNLSSSLPTHSFRTEYSSVLDYLP